jgi:transposase
MVVNLMSRPVSVVELSPGQRVLLDSFVKSGKTAYSLFQRSQIILLAAQGNSNKAISQQVNLDENAVGLWRRRWVEGHAELARWEDKPRLLDQGVRHLLSDRPRSGSPPVFTAEQVCRIIALSCEKPPAHLSHWTQAELARMAVERGIVESSSKSSIERFLKSGRFKTPSYSILA